MYATRNNKKLLTSLKFKKKTLRHDTFFSFSSFIFEKAQVNQISNIFFPKFKKNILDIAENSFHGWKMTLFFKSYTY